MTVKPLVDCSFRSLPPRRGTVREGATLKPPHFYQSQFHTGPEGGAPLVTPQFCQIQKFPQVSPGVVSMTTPQFCVSSSSSPTSLTDSHYPTRFCTTVSTPSPPDQNVADPTTVDVIHLRPGSSSSLCTRLADLGYSSRNLREGSCLLRGRQWPRSRASTSSSSAP